MRGLLIALLALALSGCNLVVSDEPMLEDSEESADPPEFRDGLWLIENDKCRVNEARPVAEWPDCAGALSVDSDTWSTPEWENVQGAGSKRVLAGWTNQSTFVVSGDPAMMEVKATQEDEETEEEYESPYLYFGVRPTAFDKQGKVTAMRLWPARCGPVTNPTRRISPEGEAVGTYVTARPFAGLTIAEYNCKAENLDALKSAIRSSEALAGNVRRAHWVRPWPGEKDSRQ